MSTVTLPEANNQASPAAAETNGHVPAAEAPTPKPNPDGNKRLNKKLNKVLKQSRKAAKAATKATNGKAPAKGPGRQKTNGLRQPQLRVLDVLGKAKAPLTRKQISEKGKVDLAMLTDYIGSHDDAVRVKNDAKIMPSLLSLGLVKASVHPGEGNRQTVAYSITGNGKKALDKAG